MTRGLEKRVDCRYNEERGRVSFDAFVFGDIYQKIKAANKAKTMTDSETTAQSARPSTLFAEPFVADDSPTVESCARIVESESGVLLGDAERVLKMFPDQSVQMVVTSPPYWSLRDYHIDGQIGLEKSVYQYIERLADVFDAVKRVLKDDGTFWLNIGDSYTSGGRKWRAPDGKNRARAMSVRPDTPEGLKPKELIGVPWRLAFALQSRGWYLRSDIVWDKPNCQPESVKDRPTKCHEYMFLLSKSERYKYDVDAVKGPNGRRIRDVWSVNTRSYKEASGHFAIFPIELIEPCIQFGSGEGDLVLDPFMGAGTSAVAASRLGRRFVGIELNPDYYNLSLNRLCAEGLRVTS